MHMHDDNDNDGARHANVGALVWQPVLTSQGQDFLCCLSGNKLSCSWITEGYVMTFRTPTDLSRLLVTRW